MAKKAKIEIFKGFTPSPGHYFRVRATNGEIIAVSECYSGDDKTSKGNAKKAAKRLVATVAKAEIVETAE